MNLETNIPKSKTPEFKESINPLSKEGMLALAIVLAVIVVISAAVYAANFGKRKESTIVPTKTSEEVTAQPTVTSLTKEATLSASPSATRKIQIKEATMTPTPTK